MGGTPAVASYVSVTDTRTTSLGLPRYHLAWRTCVHPLRFGCVGPDPPGSSEVAAGSPYPFFPWLAADDGSDACPDRTASARAPANRLREEAGGRLVGPDSGGVEAQVAEVGQHLVRREGDAGRGVHGERL